MTEVVVVQPQPITTVVVGGVGVGPQGIQGPMGGNYVHTQNTVSNVWVINHNLDMRPNYTVVDSGGSQVEGAGAWPDRNTLIISFTAAFSGSAYLS
jgi:hypothetical protein